MISVVEHYNHSGDGTAVWPEDYLEVVAIRRRQATPATTRELRHDSSERG